MAFHLRLNGPKAPRPCRPRGSPRTHAGRPRARPEAAVARAALDAEEPGNAGARLRGDRPKLEGPGEISRRSRRHGRRRQAAQRRRHKAGLVSSPHHRKAEDFPRAGHTRSGAFACTDRTGPRFGRRCGGTTTQALRLGDAPQPHTGSAGARAEAAPRSGEARRRGRHSAVARRPEAARLQVIRPGRGLSKWRQHEQKAEVIPFRRGASLDDETEIPLATADSAPAAGSTRSLPAAELDLTGKPKVWFLSGPNGSGKTALARWMGWKLASTDRQALMAALDPQNRSLATWFAGVVQPDTNDGAQTARWVMDLLDHVMERKASAILDFGGGNTALA